MEEGILLERVGDQGQDLLVLIQEQHGAQVPQSLVRKAGRGQQLQAFNLTKMGPLAECEEVEELCDIVPPHIGIVAFLPEAGADCCTLFLDNGTLISNRLCSAHIANKLLHW